MIKRTTKQAGERTIITVEATGRDAERMLAAFRSAADARRVSGPSDCSKASGAKPEQSCRTAGKRHGSRRAQRAGNPKLNGGGPAEKGNHE